MSYSKFEKAKFFQEVNHLADEAKAYMKTYNVSDTKAISALPWPNRYGVVKWALKTIRGEFPTKQEILSCCETDQQVEEFHAEWHRSMSDYR